MEGVITYAQSFFGWLIQTTLVASLVICLILLIQKILGGKLGPRWSHALWLVLLIRMILPWAPSSRVSLSNLIPSWKGQVQSRQLPDATERQDVSVPGQTAETSGVIISDQPESELATQEQVAPGILMLSNIEDQSGPRLVFLRRVLPILWLAGAIVIGAYLLVSNFALWRIVKRDCQLVNQPMLELFEECKAQMGVQSLVVVVPSSQIRSPALFGFIRPRLLMPSEMLEKASHKEMRYVFLHELAHLKRRDIYLGWLTSLLQILHWFNPLVWYAFYRMRSDRELACDALVLARTQKGQLQEYGQAIVSLVRRFSRSRPLPAMAGILESKSQLKRRIAMITQFKKNSYQWSPLTVILIVILACISLPDARRMKGSEASASGSAHRQNFRKIWIPSKPGNGVLSPDGEKLAFVSDGSLWVVPVHGKVSPDIAGEPVQLTEPMGAWDVMSFIAWSADGKWIAFNVSDEKEDAIYVVRSSGGAARKIPVEPRLRNSGYTYRLSLSTDGRVVAFSSRYIEKSGAEPPEETGELPPSVRGFFIYTIPVAGGEVKRLTDSASGEPAFSPDGKKIAFVKYYTSEKGELCGSLWIVPAAGGTPIQVNDSDLQRQAGGPIWSPDGKMIAFTSRASQEERRKEICIVPVSETGRALASPTKIELPLTTNDMLAGWTPDNKIGVFLHNPDPWAIYTVPASGGHAVQVTTTGWATHPQWSPDGQRIYFRWDGGAVAFVPSHGGKLSLVRVESDPPVGLSYPGSGNAVSPDGKQIVFSDGGDIYTVPVEGGEAKEIAQGKYPCWSPDGKSIAFIRTYQRPVKTESGWNIYIVSSKGGDVRQLTSDSDDVRRTHIDWSPDGKSIAYFAKDKTVRIIPVQGRESRIVTTAEELKNWDELAWSPDGSKLVYSSKGSIWVISSDGGEPEEIGTGLDAEVGHVSWSPDGKKLAFTAMKGGEEELYLMENFLPEVEPKDKVVRQVCEASGWWKDCSISPLGKFFAFSDRKNGYGEVSIYDLSSGTIRWLTNDANQTEGAYECVVSPDGEQIAYCWINNSDGSQELRLVGTNGSRPRTLYRDKDGLPIIPFDWSPDGKEILVFHKGIAMVSVDNGSVRVLKNISPRFLGKVNMRISPDGCYIAYDLLKKDDITQKDIYILATDGSVDAPLIEKSSNDVLLDWYPDGKSLLFRSDRTGDWDAWRIRVKGGKAYGTAELVKKDLGSISLLGFTCDGSFYFKSSMGGMDIYTAHIDLSKGKIVDGPKKPIERGVGGNVSAAWSPNGKYLAYIAGGSIHIRSEETGTEKEISPQPGFYGIEWFPDGSSLKVYGEDTEGNRGLFRVDIKTGAVETLLMQTPEVHLHRCYLGHEGKNIYYRSYRDSENLSSIFAYEIHSKKQKKIWSGKGKLEGPVPSPDGKWLAMEIYQADGSGSHLAVIPINGGEIRELTESSSGGEFVWTPDSEQLLFAKFVAGSGWGSSRQGLWVIPLKGGAPKSLNLESRMMWLLTMHPDGERIAYTSDESKAEIWAMENFLPKEIGK